MKNTAKVLIVVVGCLLQSFSAHAVNKNKILLDNGTIPKTVISGSYRKHLEVLMRLKDFLQDEGIIVLSPVGNSAINPKEEFILLDADPVHDKRILQDSIFAKMRTESFHVIANVDGYIGAAALMELGYAISHGIQVLTLEPVTDPNLIPYCRPINEVFANIDIDKIKGKKTTNF